MTMCFIRHDKRDTIAIFNYKSRCSLHGGHRNNNINTINASHNEYIDIYFPSLYDSELNDERLKEMRSPPKTIGINVSLAIIKNEMKIFLDFVYATQF